MSETNILRPAYWLGGAQRYEAHKGCFLFPLGVWFKAYKTETIHKLDAKHPLKNMTAGVCLSNVSQQKISVFTLLLEWCLKFLSTQILF